MSDTPSDRVESMRYGDRGDSIWPSAETRIPELDDGYGKVRPRSEVGSRGSYAGSLVGRRVRACREWISRAMRLTEGSLGRVTLSRAKATMLNGVGWRLGWEYGRGVGRVSGRCGTLCLDDVVRRRCREPREGWVCRGVFMRCDSDGVRG